MKTASLPVDSDRVDALLVVQDGLVAGLVGAFVVALVHLVADAWIGQPLRTPTVLGVLLIDAANAARLTEPSLEVAFRFTCVHMTVWVLLGISGSYLVSLVDARPRLAGLVFGGFTIFFISLLYGSGAFSVPGLEPLHLWAGTLLGAAAAAALLAWRHPALARHLKREHLTPTTRADIERALVHELTAWKTYRIAADRFPRSAFDRVASEKHGRAKLLHWLVNDLSLEDADASGVAPNWAAETLDEALRRAVDSERETLAFYDRFLAAVPEVRIRNVFLRLRHRVAKRTIPELEAEGPVD